MFSLKLFFYLQHFLDFCAVLSIACSKNRRKIVKTIFVALHDFMHACILCMLAKIFLTIFFIFKRCYIQHSTKIQKALSIKKHNPKLNTQLYANSFTFSLNVV